MTAATRLLALIDADAPAKVSTKERKWSSENTVTLAKMSRPTAVRIPDLMDEVTGEAAWITEDFVVVVPMHKLNTFRAWISCRGLAPGGATYEVERMVPGETTWADLYAAVRL